MFVFGMVRDPIWIFLNIKWISKTIIRFNIFYILTSSLIFCGEFAEQFSQLSIFMSSTFNFK